LTFTANFCLDEATTRTSYKISLMEQEY